jgi:hypothetical protein
MLWGNVAPGLKQQPGAATVRAAGARRMQLGGIPRKPEAALSVAVRTKR